MYITVYVFVRTREYACFVCQNSLDRARTYVVCRCVHLCMCARKKSLDVLWPKQAYTTFGWTYVEL